MYDGQYAHIVVCFLRFRSFNFLLFLIFLAGNARRVRLTGIPLVDSPDACVRTIIPRA